jgi:Rap1a immunity proteins
MRSLFALVLLVTTIFVWAHPTAAQKRTDQLLWECEGREPLPNTPTVGEAICASYLSGLIDMHAIITGMGWGSPVFCLPDQGISNDQARRIFQAWAREHPEELHETARGSVLLAFKGAFSCP